MGKMPQSKIKIKENYIIDALVASLNVISFNNVNLKFRQLPQSPNGILVLLTTQNSGESNKIDRS